MSDKLTRLEKLNNDIKKQSRLKQKSKNNRFNEDMEIESEGDEEFQEEDFIDDAEEDKKYKKKYREVEDEFDQELEDVEEQNTKKKTKNTILNYTNTTAINSNKKKVVNKQVEELDIEEIMLQAERKKKIQQEQAELLKEEQMLEEQERKEEEEKKRLSQEVKNILKDDNSSKTNSKGKVDLSVLNAMNRDISDDSNTVDSIVEVQNMIQLAKKAKEANEQLKISQNNKMNTHEINLTNLSISQIKNINDYKNSDGTLDAYFYDFYSDSNLKQDKIYAFAKVQNKQTNAFDTCVIQIDNIIRNLFFYPTSESVTEQQIRNEISDLLKKEQTSNKKVEFAGAFTEKDYAFELPIPKGKGRWYQAVMSYEYEMISPDTKGQYFSYCVGTTYSALETFLISKKVKGPCWMRLDNIQNTTSNITNRKLELRVNYAIQSNIQVLAQQLPTPPLSVACISLKTSQQIVLSQKKKEYRKEIFNINIKYHDGINIENSNKEELNQYKCVSFITHIDPAKKQDSIKNGVLAETTKFCLSEHNLLEQFLNTFNEIDPDIVVAHDLYSTVFEIILTRLREKGIRKWNLLSKLINIGSSEIPKFGSANNKIRTALKGRLLVDTLLSAQEFVNSVEYTIESLASKLFKQEISKIESKTYEQKFATFKLLNSLVDDTYLDITYSLKIMYHLQVIPLTKQLTSICGNLWIGSLQNQRAERNEMLLLHKFNEINYVLPDNFKNLPASYKKKHKNMQIRKQYDEEEAVQGPENRPAKKRENKYKGGQVFEPEKGLYNEYIVLLDFNSLYPSIIQEFNVCFSTCIRDPIPLEFQMAPFLGNKQAAINHATQKNKNKMDDEDENDEENDHENHVAQQDVLPTIEEIKTTAPLPAILKYLVDQRKVVKNQLKGQKDPQVIETLDIKQKAFKLVANSMYGCLGFSSSRFYAMPLASFITAKGRQILFDSKRVVEDLGHSVIYGDTDSLMVKPGTTDLLQAVKVGFNIKVSVNKKYKKLQLDIDGVFKNMLLLKKKKYATLKVANWEEAYQNPKVQEKLEKEVKGIDVVRRDWCQLSRDAGNKILEIILGSENSDQMDEEIKKYLTQLNDDINQKKIKNSSYYITKRLTKRVDQYGEKNLPHVAVASRIIEEKNIDPQTYVNQIINYLICKSESSKLVDKAFSPQEFIHKNRNLEIDIQYYKRFQLFEPIKRLVEVIQSINLSEIASILEINYTVQTVAQKSELSAESVLNLNSKRSQYLSSIPRILIDCQSCGTYPFQGMLQEGAQPLYIMQCKCKADITIQLKNKITLVLKELIRSYEENLFQQDEEEMDFTHTIYLTGKAKIQKISDQSLNQRLLALQAMFTLSDDERNRVILEINEKINMLRKPIDDILAKSDYNNLDLSNIFRTFGLLK